MEIHVHLIVLLPSLTFSQVWLNLLYIIVNPPSVLHKFEKKSWFTSDNNLSMNMPQVTHLNKKKMIDYCFL
jgi:hypothetical protein